MLGIELMPSEVKVMILHSGVDQLSSFSGHVWVLFPKYHAQLSLNFGALAQGVIAMGTG